MNDLLGPQPTATWCWDQTHPPSASDAEAHQRIPDQKQVSGSELEGMSRERHTCEGFCSIIARTDKSHARYSRQLADAFSRSSCSGMKASSSSALRGKELDQETCIKADLVFWVRAIRLLTGGTKRRTKPASSLSDNMTASSNVATERALPYLPKLQIATTCIPRTPNSRPRSFGSCNTRHGRMCFVAERSPRL